jgi:menaquinone-dependent protoporphyrinogen IX oxidase
MKALIIYQSKYGATAQYAEWLSEALALPVQIAGKSGSYTIGDAEYLLIGTSVYVGKLLLKKWLHENQYILKNKTLFLFIVSGGSASDKKQQQAIINANIPALLVNQCKIFFLPGRLIKKSLSWPDRFMLKMGAMLEKDPVKKNAMHNDIDAVSKTHLAGIVEAVKLYASTQHERISSKEGLSYLL